MQWPIAPMKAVTADVVPIGDVWIVRAEVGRAPGARPRRVGDDVDAVSSTGKPKLPQWPWLRDGGRRRRPTTTSSSTARSSPTTTTAATRSRASAEPSAQHAFVVFDLLAVDGTTSSSGRGASGGTLLEATVTPGDAAVDHAGERRRRRDGGGDAGAALRGHHRQARRLDLPARPPRADVGQGEVPHASRRWSSAATSSARATARARSGRCSSASTTTSGDLQFVGAVGTGFNERDAARRDGRAAAAWRPTTCPFAVAAEAARGTLPLGPSRARRPGRLPRVDRRRRHPRRRCSSACATTSPRGRRPRDLSDGSGATCGRVPVLGRRGFGASLGARPGRLGGGGRFVARGRFAGGCAAVVPTGGAPCASRASSRLASSAAARSMTAARGAGAPRTPGSARPPSPR